MHMRWTRQPWGYSRTEGAHTVELMRLGPDVTEGPYTAWEARLGENDMDPMWFSTLRDAKASGDRWLAHKADLHD